MKLSKVKKIKSSYPVLIFEDFINKDLCNHLKKSIISEKNYDDFVMNGRNRINKGSNKFQSFINSSSKIKNFYNMINNSDRSSNKLSRLEKSKWTSLKKINGWSHYEVLNVDKKNNKIELFAVCEKEKRVTITKEQLKNKQIWRRGWEPRSRKSNFLQSSLMEQLIDGEISKKAAENEVRQKVRRKAEQKMIKKDY